MTAQLLLSWFIAFMGLVYYFAERFDRGKATPEEFRIKYWLIDNLQDIAKGVTSVVILMSIFVSPTSIQYVQTNITKLPEVFGIFPYHLIMSGCIGVLNYWLLNLLRDKAKNKARTIGKEDKP
jgi:hypothetical protein